MTLLELIHDPGCSAVELAQFLDERSHPQRLEELSYSTRRDQRALWNKVAKAPPLSLEFLVPLETAPGQEVLHHGRNTLPLPFGHKFFTKVMSRGNGGSASVFGYNRAPSSFFVGPGYFLAISTKGTPEWEARAAVVIDYFQVPLEPVPEHWPTVRPNHRGLQFFVYRHTRDFMRRVSSHVSIGAAHRVERPLDHYFTLCREDPA